GKPITLMTIGVISADKVFMEDLAVATPAGLFLFAETVADMNKIFEQVAYQIQKLALTAPACRYNLDVDGSGC
nr:hypothetical protein [Vampirovibrio sp.]